MQVGIGIIDGELAAKRGNFKKAIASLSKAEELESGLLYDEPPDWFYPARHSLGAVYLDAKKPKDAEKVYLRDLKLFPENPFALFGLQRALEAQGKKKAAGEVAARFKKAWSKADYELKSSRF
jgi:tetratricopeptide (TPR) repeat protein